MFPVMDVVERRDGRTLEEVLLHHHIGLGGEQRLRADRLLPHTHLLYPQHFKGKLRIFDSLN